MMKSVLMITGIIVLAASLFGVVKSITTPSELQVNNTVDVLDYNQEGNFDFVVTAEPSFFYTGQSAAAPMASPQIPLKFIESMDFDYTYLSDTIKDGSIEIDAILENPGAWKKTINMVPQKAWERSANVSFPLDLKYFQDLGDTMEKEIGGPTSSFSLTTLTLQAVVSGRTGPDYTQVLPLKLTRQYIKIGDNLAQVNGGERGKFDYQVKLGDNTLFGPVTLTPPAGPVEASPVVLGPMDSIFIKLIHSLKVNFGYKLTSDKPLNQIHEDVMVEAILENPDKWTKTYTLVPLTQENGEFNFGIPLDLGQYSTIFDTIQEETGVSASQENFTLQATVHTNAQTAAGAIEKTYTQNITANLRDGLLKWSGDTKKSEPGSIENQQSTIQKTKILGLPVLWLRIISIFVAMIMLVLLGIFLLPYIRPGQRKSVDSQAHVRQISQKYKELIVEIRELPDVKAGEKGVSVNSLEDLIKTAQGLLKPVLHWTGNGQNIYCVFDDSVRYHFIVNPDPQKTNNKTP